MLIEELGIPPKKKEILNKKGIYTEKDLIRFVPYKYYDFSETIELNPRFKDQYVAVIATMTKVRRRMGEKNLTITAYMKDENDRNLYVTWIGQAFRYDMIKDWIEQVVFVAGKLSYSEEFCSYSILNPLIFSKDIEKSQKIMPVYSKYSGISDDYMKKEVQKAFDLTDKVELLPKDMLDRLNLPTEMEAIRQLHHPQSVAELKKAQQRIIFDDLLYFALKTKMEENNSRETDIKISKTDAMEEFIKKQKFSLTNDQRSAIDSIIQGMRSGSRTNGIVIGDVGCGKTIVALSLMYAMAENGYQSVLMAPTTVLAHQHYCDMQKFCQEFGYEAAYLSTEIKGKEKKSILKGIKDGRYQFIIGTHSVIAKDVVYQNLGLTITDEEHKFGVLQRQALKEKAEKGVHAISMSATPIPRSLAKTVYGKSTDVYFIETLPSGRKPVQTTVFSNERKICEFLLKQIKEGRQCYVVCPMIDKAEEESRMEGLASVEETAARYQSYFSAYPNIRIVSITGKTKKEESDSIFNDWKENKIQILISTTVIEVGVNTPNANAIVINNAERFGTAQLHQLRGRVGRGSYQSYCILNSMEKENTRLQILCDHTNGFKIAEEDMKERGTGDLLGTEQSGNNRYISRIMEFPNMHKRIQVLADEILAESIQDAKEIIRYYEDISFSCVKNVNCIL